MINVKCGFLAGLRELTILAAIFGPVTDKSREFSGNRCPRHYADRFCTASARSRMSASMSTSCTRASASRRSCCASGSHSICQSSGYSSSNGSASGSCKACQSSGNSSSTATVVILCLRFRLPVRIPSHRWHRPIAIVGRLAAVTAVLTERLVVREWLFL